MKPRHLLMEVAPLRAVFLLSVLLVAPHTLGVARLEEGVAVAGVVAFGYEPIQLAVRPVVQLSKPPHSLFFHPTLGMELRTNEFAPRVYSFVRYPRGSERTFFIIGDGLE